MISWTRYSKTEPNDGWSYHVEFYSQPWKDHLKAHVYHAFEDRFCKHVMKLDRLAYRIHALKCHNDCGEWTICATGNKVPGCIYNPPSIALEFRCYDLSQKNKTALGMVQLEKDVWDSLDTKPLQELS